MEVIKESGTAKLINQERWNEPLRNWGLWVPPALMALMLIIVAQYNFLAFHTLAELFAIVISFVMFAFAWSTRSFSKNNFLLFLACGYFWIGSLDLMHTFVYKGIDIVVEGSGNLSVQFWIGTRYSEALLLLAAPFAIAKKQNGYLLLIVFGSIAIGLSILILSGQFPTGFIEGVGLTSFKIYSEYLIILILGLALINLFRHGRNISTEEKSFIAISIVLTMFAELSFTFYVSVYGLSNLAGHIFKFFSYWFIFQAIVISNLKRPYAALQESEAQKGLILGTLQDSIESISEGFVLFDEDGRLIICNERYKKFYGYSDEDVVPGVHTRELGLLDIERGTVELDGKSSEYLERRDSANQLASLTVIHLKDGRILEGRDRRTTAGGIVSIQEDVTERKAAELMLESINQRMTLAADSAGIGVWDLDLTKNELVWDDWMFKLYGIKREDFGGAYEAWQQGVHPEDLERSSDEVDQAIRGEKDFDTEFRVVLPNDEVRHIKANAIIARDDEGKPLHMIGTNFDITERKQFEDKATSETQRIQKLLYNAIEVMEDGFVLFDAEDRLVLSNEKYRSMYHEVADVLKPGTTFTEIIQVAAERLQVIDSLEDKDEWLKERLERHQNPTGPFDHKLTRGDWVRVIEQKTTEGGIVGLRIDITKEKQEEQELRKLSHSLEQSPSMIFITDVEGNIEYINPMFTKISGYAVDEVIGKNPRILKSDETALDLYADLWRTIKSGLDWRGELKDRRKDGSTFWAYAIISPVKNENGEITNFVSMHEDITLRKEIEIREHKAKEQAEMANRSKSELLANMSHELRTPLNAIIGFSESMKDETFGPVGSDKNREYLDDIHQSGHHLLGLINDILDVSTIEAGALELEEENVNITDVVETSVRLIKPRADNGQVRVTPTIDPEIPLIYADARRVKQVFLNLLSNAVKFTQEGGEVTVSAQLNDDGSLAVTVADKGIGMDEEEVTKALSTFGQVDSGLDRKHEGSGLGLPLTKGLMELHGGTMEIESEKGHGTLITVTFPKERVI